MVSRHQAPCGIPPSFFKLVLRVSLVLTHIEPMLSFGILWKHKNTLRFSDFFENVPKGNIGSIGVIIDFFFNPFEKLVLSDALF